MFINTLCIGYKMVQSWVDQSSYGMHPEKASRVDTRQHIREQHKAQYEILNNFLEELPKLPGHYCRKDSLKLYLEPHFRSLSDVYKVYLSHAEEKAVPRLARKTFTKVFHSKKLISLQPQKGPMQHMCFL